MNPTNLRTEHCAWSPYLAWNGTNSHRMHNAPSPTLKCCGGVKNHLRLATTGTLRSQLLPKTSRAHLLTSLLESPSFVPNPSLLLTPGTKYSGDSSRPPYLRSFHSLSPSPSTSTTTPIPIGSIRKNGDRREGDRSVSFPSSPDGTTLPVPRLQLQLSLGPLPP